MTGTYRSSDGAEAEQAERRRTEARAEGGGWPLSREATALSLQHAAGNRAVASALAVQRDPPAPSSLTMRPPVTVVPGGGGGLFGGPELPPDLHPSQAFIRQMLADEEARRPRLTFDVYTRGMNPQLYASLTGRSPADHSPTTPTSSSTTGAAQGGAAAAHDDDNKPHFEVHAQVQAGQAANAQFNQAAVGPGARAAQAAAPGTQTSAQTQVVAGVVLQFHDDAHWGIELTPLQAQVNLDSNGHVTGWQGNAQLAIVSAAMDTILTGDDGEHWKAQLQGFVQGSAGQNFDAPDASGSSQSHPAGSLQVGGQAALVHGPIQLWLQVTGGAAATTSPGANPQFFMAPTVSAAAGITIQF